MDSQLTWLLDEKAEESGASDLRSAIEVVGDRSLTLSRSEARHGSELTVPLHASPTLAYGSIEFAKAIRNDFYPGRWCDWTALRCERYFARLGAFLFNYIPSQSHRDVIATPRILRYQTEPYWHVLISRLPPLQNSFYSTFPHSA